MGSLNLKKRRYMYTYNWFTLLYSRNTTLQSNYATIKINKIYNTKINKWNLIKPKRAFTSKNKNKKPINKTKRQPPEWEKLFANEATSKGIISKIRRQLRQLNIKKKIKKWAEDINKHFSKEDTQMAQKHINKCLTSLIIFVSQSCPSVCDPMDCSRSGFPILHHLPELSQIYVYRVSDVIQLIIKEIQTKTTVS